MSNALQHSRLLRALRAIDGELPFEDQVTGAVKCLETYLSETLGTKFRGPLQLDLQGEFPYITLAGSIASPLRESADMALQLVGHHLELVRQKLLTRDSLFEAAQEHFHELVHPLSHYMKSPLTAILGYASLLDDELDSASVQEIHHYIRRIGDNAHILIDMIDDLLYLSRLKREKTEHLNTGELVKKSLEPFEGLMVEKNLSVKVQDDTPALQMNPEHGSTVFGQLMSNALRHAFPGTEIRVGFRSGEYFIKDQGSGISRDNLEKVFHIFFTTCGKDSRCTGAGLYTVRKILQLYRGTVRIESTPGRGTSVFFSVGTDR
jgi:signal transduction histidine kinase